MNSNARGCTQFFVSANCVSGRNVDWSHKPLRNVSADGKKRETYFRESALDFLEVGAVPAISGEINSARGAFDHVAAPKSFVAVAQTAPREMPGGDGSNFKIVSHIH